MLYNKAPYLLSSQPLRKAAAVILLLHNDTQEPRDLISSGCSEVVMEKKKGCDHIDFITQNLTLQLGGTGFHMHVFPRRNHFYQFGEIRTITVVQRQQCAFIQFATRQAAEVAAEKSFNKLIVNGRRLNVKWGR